MKQIRIQSDGTGSSTKITLPDGTELAPASATIWLEARESNRVELEFVGPALDIHAELSETDMTCPVCSTKQTHYCRSELRSP